MDVRVSEQEYFRMAKTFYEFRAIGIQGLYLCFKNNYVIIGEDIFQSYHKRATNDNS